TTITQHSGLYNIKFDKNWWQVLNVTKLGDLPPRKYYSLLTFSDVGVDGKALVNENVTFRCYWRSFVTLHTALFYWNASGSMQFNGSLTLSGVEAWSNFTRTLPSSDTSYVIAWYIIANDTAGNSKSTSTQYLAVYACA
ncbi:MAG: hypothetical protein QW279_01550, partial [Candidatus Jordarchaeaceae archaeon]